MVEHLREMSRPISLNDASVAISSHTPAVLQVFASQRRARPRVARGPPKTHRSRRSTDVRRVTMLGSGASPARPQVYAHEPPIASLPPDGAMSTSLRRRAWAPSGGSGVVDQPRIKGHGMPASPAAPRTLHIMLSARSKCCAWRYNSAFANSSATDNPRTPASPLSVAMRGFDGPASPLRPEARPASMSCS